MRMTTKCRIRKYLVAYFRAGGTPLPAAEAAVGAILLYYKSRRLSRYSLRRQYKMKSSLARHSRR